MKVRRTLVKSIAVALALSFLAGCANIPDIKPFAEATAEMVTTLRKGYSHDESLMLRAIDVTSDETSARLQKNLKELKKVWEPTENALNALNAYSDALAALADAGSKGKETTDAVFDSLNGLIGAVSNLAIPANVKPIAEAIGREVAALRAEKDLKKAVNSVANIISREGGVADILAQNFAELRKINDALGNDIEANLIVKNRNLINYHDGLTVGDLRVQRILTKILEFEDIPNKVREQADNRRMTPADGETPAQAAAAAQRILDGENALKRETFDDLKSLDAGIPAGLAYDSPDVVRELEKRRNELLAISKGYRAELDRIAPDYKVVDDEIKEVKELTRNGDRIFDKSQKAIKAWAKAHDNLRLALEKKQKRVTVLGLLSIVREIADALNQGDKGDK